MEAHATTTPGFKIDEQALFTLRFALSHRLVSILQGANLAAIQRRRSKVCLKDVKIAMDVTTCKLRCSIGKGALPVRTADAAIAKEGSEDEESEAEWGGPRKPRSCGPNPIGRNNMPIHLEASKSEWLRVTETGLRTMMDEIVTTPHAANAASTIMRGLTTYHINPPGVHRRWNCFAKVRIRR